tara:strand:+ start:496 stop:1422 length:927 start_codon:yes stop_codon:yes gene_type:complete
MQMSEGKAAHEADDGQVDLDFDEEAQEVEIEAPAQAESTQEQVAQVEDNDEHEKYSQSVQKRINQLTKRAKEAEREREEALRYAQTVQSENTNVKQRLQNLDTNYIAEYGNRVTSEQTRAKEALKTAIETGDVESQMAAQERIAQLSIAADKHAQAKAQRETQAAQQQAYLEQQAYEQSQYVPAQEQSAPDPKAEDWASKNNWFGEDDAMTFAAFGIHKKLVQDEGFDPSSNDYYDALDSRMRDAFPHRFDEGQSRNTRSGQTVAGVSRSKSSSGRGRKVRLSPSQVTIAKRLGVPLEEYAKYVKEEQ